MPITHCKIGDCINVHPFKVSVLIKLCEKMIEKYKSEGQYKNISKGLNLSRTSVKSIIKKWEEYGTRKSAKSRLSSQTQTEQEGK